MDRRQMMTASAGCLLHAQTTLAQPALPAKSKASKYIDVHTHIGTYTRRLTSIVEAPPAGYHLTQESYRAANH